MLTETETRQAESKAEFWRRHIKNCTSSSQTQAQYCREHSLVLATFCYWKKKLNMTRQSKARFYPLTVQPAKNPCREESSSSGLSLYCRNDNFRIELSEDFSVSTLTKLIAVLEQK